MLARSFHHRSQALAPLIAAWQDSGPSCSGRDYPSPSMESQRNGRLLLNTCCPLSRVHGRHCSTSNPKRSTPEPNLEELFTSSPHAAAQELVEKLSPAQRAVLAAVLAQHTDMQQFDEKYWEELFKAHDNQDNTPGALTRSEFQAAMMAHTSLLENRNKSAPPDGALKMVFLASAIPFIGFGFLDNAIMLVAGEEIDHLFGIRLGLSTLASAGLGNALADVIGVGAAKYIERLVRWLPCVKEPRLSKYQQMLPGTQRAKLAGAMIGVFTGCLLGLTPLFMSGSFFTR